MRQGGAAEVVGANLRGGMQEGVEQGGNERNEDWVTAERGGRVIGRRGGGRRGQPERGPRGQAEVGEGPGEGLEQVGRYGAWQGAAEQAVRVYQVRLAR